jgi:ABC-type oligopeptide transport system ATPase subunit
MKFKQWMENRVLAHVAGPSGSGKTTLAKQLAAVHYDVLFKDLDDFDDEGEKLLGFDDIQKKNYTDEMLQQLAAKRQALMNDFVKKADKPIVFVGHHTEGDHVLDIPTNNRFLLNTDAKTSAKRGYQRSQNEDPKHRRTIDEIPEDEKEAQKIIDWLLSNGYKPLSKKEITQWMTNAKTNKKNL